MRMFSFITAMQILVFTLELHTLDHTGRSAANPAFLERGFICLKVLGLVLLILSTFS